MAPAEKAREKDVEKLERESERSAVQDPQALLDPEEQEEPLVEAPKPDLSWYQQDCSGFNAALDSCRVFG